MNRHAYLIMCHNNFEQLVKLLQLLDAPQNDLYIHIDRKADCPDTGRFVRVVEKASITFIERRRVNWGGFSQIQTELDLLRTATKTSHLYYHLLSGADLPIKSQEYIYNFFEGAQGKEFISIDESSLQGFDSFPRIGSFHFFQELIGRNTGLIPVIAEHLERYSINLQSALKLNRLDTIPYPIYKGSNWFSITHDMAVFLLSREKEIKRHFQYGLCADELFLQTIAMQSPFADRITSEKTRLIDWDRGSPYTWKMEDYPELKSSPALFARKFDSQVCMEIIDKLFTDLMEQNTQANDD